MTAPPGGMVTFHHKRRGPASNGELASKHPSVGGQRLSLVPPAIAWFVQLTALGEPSGSADTDLSRTRELASRTLRVRSPERAVLCREGLSE